VLTAQTTSNFGRQTTESFACGINDIPVVLHFSRLGAESFHRTLPIIVGLDNEAVQTKWSADYSFF
jgi:hypothetical protein